MTTNIYYTDTVGSGVQADLGTSLNAYVRAGVLLASTDDTAILGTGGFQSVVVAGDVVGDHKGVDLGAVGVGFSYLEVRVGASVEGTHEEGVRISGYGNVVDNAGTIESDALGGAALILESDPTSFSTFSTLINTGKITAFSNAVLLSQSGNANEELHVINSGLIEAKLATGTIIQRSLQQRHRSHHQYRQDDRRGPDGPGQRCRRHSQGDGRRQDRRRTGQ